MIREGLVGDLRRVHRALEDDLLSQIESPTLSSQQEASCAASVWIIATVLVRFCEDNQLTDTPFLAGPADRLALARERQEMYFYRHPERNDRDWIVESLDSLATSPTTLRLVESVQPLLRRHPMSPYMAKDLLGFWRRLDQDGRLVHDFSDATLDTSFLADLYARLSESDRKKFALMQTPDFVADLILDRTLKPAIDTLGLAGLRVIDPVCGSGTFLRGAFQRLLRAWREEAPDADDWELIRNALTSLHGVDKNPVAVIVSRFRLLIDAMVAAGSRRFSDVPDLPLVVGVGDSLLPGDELEGFHPAINLLGRGSYDVVVGNPPYIVPQDPDDAARYRDLYRVCRGKFGLPVPFTARFFVLARYGSDQAGFVGLLLADSFMKREFGRTLIEEFLSQRDLTHILDTTGAFIPGHGTPTVILLGRARLPSSPTIRVAAGQRGEPAEPVDPATGLVWQALTRQIDQPDSRSDWITVTDVQRSRFAKHPWILSDPIGSDLRESLQTTANPRDGGGRLGKIASRIGYSANTGSDDAFVAPAEAFKRVGAEPEATVTIVTGEEVRDWTVTPGRDAFFPLLPSKNTLDITKVPHHYRRLWPNRTLLRARTVFGGQRIEDTGRAWYSWHQIANNADTHAWSIVFAWVATHPHFTILREGLTPLHSAPFVKLPDSASEDDFSGLTAILNSSTACFWLKQHSHAKGASRADQMRAEEPWEDRYEFTSASLSDLPIPAVLPYHRGQKLDALAQQKIAVSPERFIAYTPSREAMSAARSAHERISREMIAEQEELDWNVYGLYGLIGESQAAELVADPRTVPEVRVGERAFEIYLARRSRDGIETQWFARHGATPVLDVPEHWNPAYRRVVAKRIEMIEHNPRIEQLERPEYKRRWYGEPWDRAERRALRAWLLNRCEERSLWYSDDEPRPMTVDHLADRLRLDPDVVSVARALQGPGWDLADTLREILDDEHVPFLSQYRYKPSGMGKRRQWEATWDLQREEDAEGKRLDIPVPPKYTSADFQKPSYWRHRGKLDVPKERFISYPHASPDGDNSLLIGWAGWDYREQAAVLIGLIEERSSTDGWEGSRLTGLLAGLLEVMPWVRQWHGEIQPEFGQSFADAYDQYLSSMLAAHGLSREELIAWKAPPPRRGRPPKKAPTEAPGRYRNPPEPGADEHGAR